MDLKKIIYLCCKYDIEIRVRYDSYIGSVVLRFDHLDSNMHYSHAFSIDEFEMSREYADSLIDCVVDEALRELGIKK